MIKSELHEFLTSTFDLVVDPVERGNGRTYFLKRVDWRPGSTTRVLRVESSDETVRHIRLCVSSDNNNSVFAIHPLRLSSLVKVVGDEIGRLHEREGASG
ncbi:hypothetical protein F1599_18840 [Cupriavidus cauae]|uniref:Uncharacterized protein n=1 Tax=Cupriavidus cauae TaxID=2608999 RepID=A0A5M8AA91_9BURK|nr:hypothetical protein F1599_18840 [Cupriavidus cauae]